LVKQRYLGVRPIKDAPPFESGKLVLHNLRVGSGNVSFYDSNVYLADTEYTPEKWLELRRRVDKVMIERGQIEEVALPKAPWEGRSCGLLEQLAIRTLTANRKRRWWLRWLL